MTAELAGKPADGRAPAIVITPRTHQSLLRRAGAGRTTVWGTRVLLAVATLGGWQYLSNYDHKLRFFISSPTEVWRTLVSMLGTELFWSDAYVTLRETAIGFAISAVTGSITGFALAQSNFANRVLGPFISALNSLPRIALASLFILYFGLGEASKIALAVSLVYFVFLINIYQGAASVSEELEIVMKTMGANRAQVIRKVTLQSTTPWAIAASRLGMSQAIAAVVIAEMLSAQRGLGAELVTAGSTFDTARQFAILVCLLVVAMALNEGLGYAERRTRSWSSRQT
jgi:NitT/TauT family transport system permease protein